MIFNFYHVSPPFVKLGGSRFLHFFSLCNVRNEGVFVLQEHSSLRGLNRKNTSKNMKFWPLNPYYKRSNWTNLTSRKIFWSLTSKLWNKKIHTAEAYWNGAKLNYIQPPPPYGFIKNLWQIHSKDSHMEFMGKNKVGNTTWTELCSLVGQKWQNSFQ